MKLDAHAVDQTTQLVAPTNQCPPADKLPPALTPDNPIMQRIFRRMADAPLDGITAHDKHGSHNSHNTFSQGWLDPPRPGRG